MKITWFVFKSRHQNQRRHVTDPTLLPEFKKTGLSCQAENPQRLAREKAEEQPGASPVVMWNLQENPGPGSTELRVSCTGSC